MYPTKAILLVSFDLKGTPTDYAKLWELLKGQEGWSHYLPATWLVATKKTPTELRGEIKETINTPGDRFIIVRVEEFAGWMPKEQWEWIRKHREESAQLEINK
jgi:hypothetical protein